MKKLISIVLALVTASATALALTPSADSETIDCGQTVILTATPVTANGYHFDHWELGGSNVGSDNPMEITPTGDAAYKAIFALNEYTVTYSKGSATGAAGSDFTGTKTHGVNLTLSSDDTHFTRTGYHVAGWASNAAGTTKVHNLGSAYTYNMDTTFYPYWAPNTNTTYTVEHYKQNLDGSTYPASPTVTDNLTGTTGETTAAVAKSFDGFTKVDFSQGTIKADGSTVVKIYYTRNSYTVSFYDGTNATPLQTGTYYYGQAVSYGGSTPTKAQTAECTFTFAAWDNTIVTPVVGAANYTATFECTKRKYMITFNNWDGSELEKKEVEYGETPVYSGATPTKAGSSFSGWSPEVTAVTGAATYTAQFNASTYLITVNVETPATGTVTGGGSYSYSATPSLTATPADCYQFVKWKKNGVDYTTTQNPTITVTEAAAYTAVFEKKTYTITVMSDDNTQGTVTVTVKP